MFSEVCGKIGAVCFALWICIAFPMRLIMGESWSVLFWVLFFTALIAAALVAGQKGINRFTSK